MKLELFYVIIDYRRDSNGKTVNSDGDIQYVSGPYGSYSDASLAIEDIGFSAWYHTVVRKETKVEIW